MWCRESYMSVIVDICKWRWYILRKIKTSIKTAVRLCETNWACDWTTYMKQGLHIEQILQICVAALQIHNLSHVLKWNSGQMRRLWMKSRQDAGRLISSALIECKCLQVWMVKYFRQVSSVDLTTVQCILHSHVACRSGIIRMKGRRMRQAIVIYPDRTQAVSFPTMP